MKRIRLLLVLSVLFSIPLSLYANPEKKLSLETRKKTLLEIANDLKRFGDDIKSRIAIKQIKEAKNQSELNTAIDPMTLIDVSINPGTKMVTQCGKDHQKSTILLSFGHPSELRLWRTGMLFLTKSKGK